MSKTITLVQIAKSIKMTPKNARRKLRATVKGHRRGNDWVFPVAKRGQIVKLLRG